jgi:hypothetical protein
MDLLKGLVNDAEHRLWLVNTVASYSEGSLFDYWNRSLLSWQEHFVFLSDSEVAWNIHARFWPHPFQVTIRIIFPPRCYLTYAAEKRSLNTKKTDCSSHALLALKHRKLSVNYFAFAWSLHCGYWRTPSWHGLFLLQLFIWTTAFCWLFPIRLSKSFIHLLLH